MTIAAVTAGNVIDPTTFGNAVVDILNDMEWASYTPAWTNLTVGNATQSGFYRYVNGSIEAVGLITLGSTSSVGTDVTQTVPDSASIQALSTLPIGLAALGDTGTGTHQGVITYNSATTVRFLRQSVSGSNILVATLTASTPFTWATGDTLAWSYSAKLA